MNHKIIENELIQIYENEKKERTVNARELHAKLESKQEFANWIKNRIKKYEFLENEDYFRFDKFIKGDEKGYGNKKMLDYLLTIDTAKELAMIEHNQIGRKIRRYFIEVEKRYQNIVSNPTNIFDCIRLALDQIEANQNEIQDIKLLSENNTQ